MIRRKPGEPAHGRHQRTVIYPHAITCSLDSETNQKCRLHEAAETPPFPQDFARSADALIDPLLQSWREPFTVIFHIESSASSRNRSRTMPGVCRMPRHVSALPARCDRHEYTAPPRQRERSADSRRMVTPEAVRDGGRNSRACFRDRFIRIAGWAAPATLRAHCRVPIVQSHMLPARRDG